MQEVRPALARPIGRYRDRAERQARMPNSTPGSLASRVDAARIGEIRDPTK